MSEAPRYIDIILVNPSDRLPMPSAPRFFDADGERVDGWDPFWLQLLADGSVRLKDAPPSAPEDSAPESPVS
jgi:hypothetical protein